MRLEYLWYNAYDGTSRRLSDASISDPSIRSWTATKWLGSDFCLPQVLEGGSYEPNEPPLRTGLQKPISENNIGAPLAPQK